MQKRLFDLAVALLCLYLTGPVLVLVMVALKVQSRGPIFWVTTRVGRDGNPFRMFRFRTMDDGPADSTGDRRLTPVGRFIRNYSLDDLPQLFSILRGDMSIVGPRPTEPRDVDLSDPAWQRVLAVKPGPVSYAILRLARDYNRTPWPRRLELELDYIQNQSLALDWQLLGEFFRAHFASRGNVKMRGNPSI